MAEESLTDRLETLHISEPEYLLYNPDEDRLWLRQKFDSIPRYLFRVSSPCSDGWSTDRLWVRSKAGRHGRAIRNKDIFTQNNNVVAKMLNVHLRWWGRSDDLDDNFVSWTSSLLFACQYIFYRHREERDESSLDDIQLCIIDTLAYPQGVFLRDMDLIRAYRSFDHSFDRSFDRSFDCSLGNLETLRKKQHKNLHGSYYFGKYLSQGVLRVQGESQIVPAQTIIDQGLFLLRPEFQRSMVLTKPEWAETVLRLREEFYQGPEQEITTEEILAAMNIAQLFGGQWRLPVAAYFMALRPRQENDEAISEAFKTARFTGRSVNHFPGRD